MNAPLDGLLLELMPISTILHLRKHINTENMGNVSALDCIKERHKVKSRTWTSSEQTCHKFHRAITKLVLHPLILKFCILHERPLVSVTESAAPLSLVMSAMTRNTATAQNLGTNLQQHYSTMSSNKVSNDFKYKVGWPHHKLICGPGGTRRDCSTSAEQGTSASLKHVAQSVPEGPLVSGRVHWG